MKIAKKKNVTRLNKWNEGFGALEEAFERAKKWSSCEKDYMSLWHYCLIILPDSDIIL